MNKNNRFRCSVCEKLVDAKKRMCIAVCPLILTVQLKRFDFTFTNRGDKITKAIEFGEKLDISRYTLDPESYELYGVLVHSGSTMV